MLWHKPSQFSDELEEFCVQLRNTDWFDSGIRVPPEWGAQKIYLESEPTSPPTSLELRCSDGGYHFSSGTDRTMLIAGSNCIGSMQLRIPTVPPAGAVNVHIFFHRKASSRPSLPAASNAKGYLDKAAAEPGAVRTDSGLVYRELRSGYGRSPKANDTVRVNYRGTLINGTEFDSSYKRGQPAQFPLNGVIACWTEGLQKMRVGGKSKLVCPSGIAYGDSGSPPMIPGGATLIFEVELLGIGSG